MLINLSLVRKELLSFLFRRISTTYLVTSNFSESIPILKVS